MCVVEWVDVAVVRCFIRHHYRKKRRRRRDDTVSHFALETDIVHSDAHSIRVRYFYILRRSIRTGRTASTHAHDTFPDRDMLTYMHPFFVVIHVFFSTYVWPFTLSSIYQLFIRICRS